ncbi:WD40/YVTN/BNR-like repeat-containing protein [Candidatus Latescibacterota bacterium]
MGKGTASIMYRVLGGAACFLVLALRPAPASAEPSWELLFEGPPAGVVSRFVAAPSDPGVLYVGTLDGRVFRSGDGGHTWERLAITVSPPAEGSRVTHLVVHPEKPDHLYVEFEDHGPPPHRSRDGGRTWELLGSPGPVGAVRPGDPDTLYAGRQVSYDDGVTWTEPEGLDGNLEAAWVNPREPGAVLQGRHLSLDGGHTWRQVLTFQALRFAGDPEDALRIYAATQSGLDISIDGGRTFSVQPEAVRGHIRDVAVVQGAPGNVYALHDFPDDHRLLWSADRGYTWTRIGESLVQHTGTDLWRQVVALGPGHLLVRTESDPEMRSRDDGEHADLWETRDNGETWTCFSADALSVGDLRMATSGRLDGHQVWFAGNSSGVFRREETDAEWERLPAPEPARIVAAAENANRVFGGLRSPPDIGPGLWRSSDGGRSWTHAPYPGEWPGGWPVPSASGDVVYTFCDRQLFRSIDGGQSWSRRSFIGGDIREFWVNPHDAHNLHARLDNGNWIASEDGGLTWQTGYQGLAGLAMGWHPIDPRQVLAGYVAGEDLGADREWTLFHSVDGGYQWRSLHIVAPRTAFRQLEILPTRGGGAILRRRPVPRAAESGPGPHMGHHRAGRDGGDPGLRRRARPADQGGGVRHLPDGAARATGRRAAAL